MRPIQLDSWRLTPATRQGRLLAKGGGIFTVLVCVLHIAIGADPLVACLAGLAVIISIYPIAIHGFLNIGAVLIAMVGFRYVGFPFFAKLTMGQPLDTYLLDPAGSFWVVLLGLQGYLFAFSVASNLPVGRPALKLVTSNATLARISFLAAIIGIMANLSVAFRAGEQYTGLTVAEFFVPFLHLALISAIARVLQATEKRRGLDMWIICLLIAEIAFAMVKNSRMALMETFLCFIVTVISFEAKIRWRQFLFTVFAIVMVIIFATPVFLYVRDSRDDLSWTQRIEATLEMVLKWPEAFAEYQEYRDLANRSGWHLNYYGSPQNIFERTTLVNHVDVIKAGSDIYGPVGLEDMKLCLKRAMPRALSPDKPREYSQGSWLYEKIGLSNQGPFATAPLIGTGYAAFGWAGAFFYPLVLGLAWFLIVKKISGWHLQGNVWAIYLLLRIHNQFVEGASDAYVVNVLRSLPQDLFLLWLIEIFARGRFLHPWRKMAV
ncbi:hypothetical protein [Desulfosarcina widdelii]|uniref:hypothetical protein n=1 Tax=Desulfosarcina widdelii TaxID=947919 RepID=UPI0012D2AB7C|nr:hypothetical protein [Desulfosarcina widdelii]